MSKILAFVRSPCIYAADRFTLPYDFISPLESQEMKNPLTEKYERWFKRNAIGEQKESEGKFEDAIRAYEANVGEGAYTLFPYERLAILYKRKRDDRNEKRIIKKAIKKLHERSIKKPLDSYLFNLLSNLQRRLVDLTEEATEYLYLDNSWAKKRLPY